MHICRISWLMLRSVKKLLMSLMKWAALARGCVPAAPVKKVSRSYFENLSKRLLMNVGYESERNLCAGCLQTLQSHWYPQRGWEEMRMMQMLRQSSWQPQMQAVSSAPGMSSRSWELSHLVTDSKPSPVQPAGHWESLLFLADLHHHRLPAAGAEGTQQELQSGPLLPWSQTKSK